MDRNRGGVDAVGACTTLVGLTVTRPADTTAYVANDRVGVAGDSDTTALPAMALGRIPGGSGYITCLRLWTNRTTTQMTASPAFRLHFFKVAQPTGNVPGDNSAFPTLFENFAQRIASVDLDAVATPGGSGSDCAIVENYEVRIPFETVAPTSAAGVGDRNIYVALETLTAFAPSSGQLFYLEATVEQN